MAGGCRVLVVDDDPDGRGSVAAVLEAEGYSVVEAEDGLDALKQLRASTCTCLVVLDLFMPIMNGWTFREEQMRDPALANIPVVIVSADSSAARQASSLGVEAAMAKPLDFDRFLDVVGRYC